MKTLASLECGFDQHLDPCIPLRGAKGNEESFAVGNGESRLQLRTAAERLTTAEMRDIAEEIVAIIDAGEDDERVRRVWEDEVHVVVSEIIGRCLQRTEIGRRKRFRPVLEAGMRRSGWVPLGLNRFGRSELEVAA